MPATALMTADEYLALGEGQPRTQLIEGEVVLNAPQLPHQRVCIEIRSPSTWRYDVGVKKTIYEQQGLAELWLVDTRAQTVLVFSRSTPEAKTFDVVLELERDEQLTSPQLRGFSLALSELFADL